MTKMGQIIRIIETNKQNHLDLIRTPVDLRRGLKKTVLLLSSIIILLITISCKTDSTYSNYIVDTIVPTGNEKYVNESSDYIFDQNALHTFELSIPLSNLKKIDSDPAAEEYVAANLKLMEKN